MAQNEDTRNFFLAFQLVGMLREAGELAERLQTRLRDARQMAEQLKEATGEPMEYLDHLPLMEQELQEIYLKDTEGALREKLAQRFAKKG